MLEAKSISSPRPNRMVGYSVTICFHERSPVCQMSSKVSSIFCISETMV
ncbi:Uncharacterised protein [Segatella copri]|nr:Uncharacterised protein [Segatella copri]